MDNINHIYKNHPKPMYRGIIENADAAGNADSDSLQTRIGFTSRINQTTIIDIKFTCYGQDSASVFASYLAGLVKGKDIFQAAFIYYRYLQPYFNAAPDNLKPAALTALRAFSDMLSSYRSSTDQKLYPLDDNRVVVAMSGGIDSSVTAKMLVEEGYQVIGVTLKVLPDSFNYQNRSKTCCSPTDITLARRVCLELGIPHLVLDVADEFKETIIDTFFDKYMQGITPNPCVDCNPRIKFGLLLDRAIQLGAGYIATGHYCILEKKQDTCIIKKGIDQTKDQSYMLWKLNQHQLSHIKFPLGGYHKRDIKKMGFRYFPFLKGKPESQDICFISPQGYQHYLAAKFDTGEGNILNSQGQILGRHKGYPYYTIGQRKGLGISHARPLYVKKIIPEQNAVVVGEKEELLQKEFIADQLNFLTGNPPSQKFRGQIMIRYNFKPAPATIELLDSQSAKCFFDIAQLAITPGQSAVFYQDDLLLGGGIIT